MTPTADTRGRAGFTKLENRLLDDPLVSAKAKGLYAYLASRPPEWAFRVPEIASHFRDGQDSIRAGLDELVEMGMITWRKDRDKNGRQTSEIRLVNPDRSENPERFSRPENPERKTRPLIRLKSKTDPHHPPTPRVPEAATEIFPACGLAALVGGVGDGRR